MFLNTSCVSGTSVSSDPTVVLDSFVQRLRAQLNGRLALHWPSLRRVWSRPLEPATHQLGLHAVPAHGCETLAGIVVQDIAAHGGSAWSGNAFFSVEGCVAVISISTAPSPHTPDGAQPRAKLRTPRTRYAELKNSSTHLWKFSAHAQEHSPKSKVNGCRQTTPRRRSRRPELETAARIQSSDAP